MKTSWQSSRRQWASLASTLISRAHSSEKVVVWLHGAGASMEDLIPCLGELPSFQQLSYDHVFLQAPYAHPLLPGGWIWFPVEEHLAQLASHPHPDRISPQSILLPGEFYRTREVLRQAFQELSERYHRGIVIGFSQGGMMGLDYALTQRIFSQQGFLKALALLSTTAVTPEQESLWPPADAPMSLPVFQSHGRQDKILPFVLGQQLARILTACNPQAVFHPFSGEHSLPLEVFKALDAWLMERV